MAPKSLALAIPTYRRAVVLEENLLAMRAELEALDTPVHVLDDSPDDATQAMVARLQTRTRLRLFYRQNRPALRHDANLIAALGVPEADHVWLLGDGGIIEPGGLRAVHEAVQHDPDFVFVNTRPGAAPPSQRLAAEPARRFIAGRAWDFTHTGATVYSRRVIDWWNADPRHQPYANFPHLSIVLGYLAAQPALEMAWLGERLVSKNQRKSPSYWMADPLPVWAGDWHRVVTANAAALPAGSLRAVLRSHSVQTGLLGYKHLLVLKAMGRLDHEALARHGAGLIASSSAGWLGVQAIAALPLATARAIVQRRPSWRRRFMPEAEGAAATARA